MQLKDLAKRIPGSHVEGESTIEVTSLSSNSKQVSPGSLFIAKKGEQSHGASYILEAIERGAVAIAVETYQPDFSKISQLIHPSLSKIEANLATLFFDNPSDELFVVGITGTNGKTTTSYLVKYFFDLFFGPSGLIGTIECILGTRHFKSERTTPDLITNYRFLREMVDEGCNAAVMEVSSHGLEQGRVDGIEFDCAIFSNLTHEHLDYHGSMENYCKAKNRLFRSLKKGKWAVVNQDSPWTEAVLEGCQARILTYGIDNLADLRATEICFNSEGTTALVTYQGQSIPFSWPLVGRFNVYNCLSTIAVLLIRGVSLEKIAASFYQAPCVRGRLQQIPNALQLKVYIDYAHSDDSLKNVLVTLREIANGGNIIVVFGCGGDRDKFKRPLMATVSEKYGDFTIVTTDNPRSEDPEAICDEIIQGFSENGSFVVVLDRRKAIEEAIMRAQPNDVVLIAGKGHETSQIFQNEILYFDDATVVLETCKRNFSGKI